MKIKKKKSVEYSNLAGEATNDPLITIINIKVSIFTF